MTRNADNPSNVVCTCECHSDSEVKHPTPCCFVCPMCKQNIVAHIYNAHIDGCSRADALALRREQQTKDLPTADSQTRVRPRPVINIPVGPGSARTRYRKR